MTSVAVRQRQGTAPISSEPGMTTARTRPGVRREGRYSYRHPQETSVLDCLDDLVRHVFTVSLTLASCVHLVRQPAAGGLNEAIAQLDTIIRDLRTAAFKNAQELAAWTVLWEPPGEVPLSTPAQFDIETVLGVLDQLEAGTSSLADSAVAQRRDPTHLLEAAQGIQRALINLKAHSLQGLEQLVVAFEERGRAAEPHEERDLPRRAC